MITDIGMPEMDGYELLTPTRRIQGRTGRPVPAIALTAFARPEDRHRALQSGFDLYLTKPVQPTAMLAAAARVAGRSAGPPN